MPRNSNRMGGRDIVNALFTYADMQHRAKALNQQGELANKDLKERMLGRKHKEKIENEELKLKKEAVPTAERTMSQEQLNESLKQVPKVHTPISSGEFAVMDAQIRNWSKANGMQMEKALAPFKNFAQNLTQTQGYTRYQTFKAAVENWDNLKVEPLKAIQKSLDNATELGDAKAIEKFAKMIDSFDAKPGETPEVLKGVFAASYQYDQDLKRKGAIDEQKNLPKNAEAAIIRELNKPKPDSERLETLRQMMTQGKAKEERLYPTTEGYQPREDAIGKMKPKGEKSTQPRSMKTWTLPDGSNITIANNQEPPEGAVPFKDPRMLKKDLAAAEEKIIANMNDSRSEPHIKLFNENSDASHFYLFDPGKKEGVIRKFFGSSDDKTTKIQLPIVKGRQTTLKDLRETAKKHNKTLEQVLKEYAEKQKKGKK